MKTNYIKGLLAFITLIMSSCDVTEPEPTPKDYHNKILFTSSRSGKAQLYMMNPDGADIIQITTGQYWHNNGRWSPDAQKIVCNTEEGTTTAGFEMVVMNSDGSNRKLLGWGDHMSWSPDDKKIAFSFMPRVEFGYRTTNIYYLSIDSNKVVELTNVSGAYETLPAWAGDCRTLFFSSNGHDIEEMNPDIYSIDIVTKELKRITVTENGYSTSPSVSPLGNEIAYVSNMGGISKAGIFIMNTDGTNIKLITQPPQDEVFNFPDWSPNSENLVVISGVVDGTARTYLYEINILNKSYRKLLQDDSTVSSVDWSK
jgi:Tol biopolymer transport system component